MTEEDKNEEIELEMDNLVSDVIRNLKDGNIKGGQYDLLMEGVKNHKYYEEDDYEVDINDVAEYIDWESDDSEKEMIAEWCGYEDIDKEVLSNIKVKTLDEQYKFEVLAKLFKVYGTSWELEAALGPELLKKAETQILDD